MLFVGRGHEPTRSQGKPQFYQLIGYLAIPDATVWIVYLGVLPWQPTWEGNITHLLAANNQCGWVINSKRQ